MRGSVEGRTQRTGKRSKVFARVGGAVCATAVFLAASGSSATAAVTIGQTGPPTGGCDNTDLVQPTVTSGSSYVVPTTGGIGNWTITSWSTQAGPVAGMLAMKAYRPLGGPTYRVIGHDGPRTLTPSTLNTFPASVAVKAGDVLGVSAPAVFIPGCRFVAPMGDAPLYRSGNLADGEQGDFNPDDPGERLNISAVVSPQNSFTLGIGKRNKKKGTATITVKVPNPGTVSLSGNGVKKRTATPAGAGSVKLLVKAKGSKKQKLDSTGKVNVHVKVTYTPTGGSAASHTKKLKLKKLLPRVRRAPPGDGSSGQSCAPGYSPCLPIVGDLNCADIPSSKKPVTVTGSDPYGLDADHDGVGCET